MIVIGFGDSLTPVPETIDYPTILDFPSPRIRAYHPATVIAEKFNAMVVLGIMNSRLKDFYDVHVILCHMNVDKKQIADAIVSTFKRRNTPLPTKIPLALTEEFANDGNKEIQWKAFLKRSSIESCNISFKCVIHELKDKLWPIVQQLHK